MFMTVDSASVRIEFESASKDCQLELFDAAGGTGKNTSKLDQILQACSKPCTNLGITVNQFAVGNSGQNHLVMPFSVQANYSLSAKLKKSARSYSKVFL